MQYPAAQWKPLCGLDSSWVATPGGERHTVMCPGLRLCSAMP